MIQHLNPRCDILADGHQKRSGVFPASYHIMLAHCPLLHPRLRIGLVVGLAAPRLFQQCLTVLCGLRKDQQMSRTLRDLAVVKLPAFFFTAGAAPHLPIAEHNARVPNLTIAVVDG